MHGRHDPKVNGGMLEEDARNTYIWLVGRRHGGKGSPPSFDRRLPINGQTTRPTEISTALHYTSVGVVIKLSAMTARRVKSTSDHPKKSGYILLNRTQQY